MIHRILIPGSMGFVGGRVTQSLVAASVDYEVNLGSRAAHANPSWLPSAQVVAMDLRSPLRVLTIIFIVTLRAGLNTN
jgi:uncharacterized protein YbjT (DUF2867 family)